MSKPISSIIAICLLAFTGLAQTSERPRFYCSYGEENRGAELCARMQMESFASNAHAERAVDGILKPVGLRPNFVLVLCPNINNARAVTYEDGVRYIVYDNAFMERIDRGANTDWASLSILAHEVGHHLQGHTLRRVSLQQRRMNELEADEFSGFVMFKLGASLSQAQVAMNSLRDVDDEENSTHPKKWRRLAAIKTGYDSAKSQQPIGNIDNQPSAEAFFSKAFDLFEQKRYREAIFNYTEALQLNPNFANAYSNRGAARHKLQDYQGAIEDQTEAIRLNSKNANAYYNRGASKYALQDYRGAIEDYTQAIRFDPNHADAHHSRGAARHNLQDYQGAIEDQTEAIRIKPTHANAYYNRGSTKYSLRDYRGAIEDFNKAIQLDSSFSESYKLRAAAKAYLGDRSGACEDFRRACGMGNNEACSNVPLSCN